MKRYVVRAHYNKRGPLPWSVHYRGKCYSCSLVRFLCWAKTEYKADRKSNPKAFVVAYAQGVKFVGTEAVVYCQAAIDLGMVKDD